MDSIESLRYYSKNLFNGTCVKNFLSNNTKDPKQLVIAKVMGAAIIAGIVTLFISIPLVPLTILVVGAGMFAYLTAEGKSPPPEFEKNAIEAVNKKRKKKNPQIPPETDPQIPQATIPRAQLVVRKKRKINFAKIGKRVLPPNT